MIEKAFNRTAGTLLILLFLVVAGGLILAFTFIVALFGILL